MVSCEDVCLVSNRQKYWQARKAAVFLHDLMLDMCAAQMRAMSTAGS
jgi:hypothetical protein